MGVEMGDKKSIQDAVSWTLKSILSGIFVYAVTLLHSMEADLKIMANVVVEHSVSIAQLKEDSKTFKTIVPDHAVMEEIIARIERFTTAFIKVREQVVEHEADIRVFADRLKIKL